MIAIISSTIIIVKQMI